jgi:type VI secretion system secreted protein Hcp
MNRDQAAMAVNKSDSMIGNANTGQGTNDVFLKLDGIEGESTDPKHKGEIEIRDFDFVEWQQGSSGSGGGSGASRPTFEVITVRCPASKAGPKLLLACAKGLRIGSAIFSFRKSGGGQQDYMTWKLTDVAVNVYSQAIEEYSDGSLAISDGFRLDYAKIEVTYKPQNPDGSLGSPLDFSFDLRGK